MSIETYLTHQSQGSLVCPKLQAWRAVEVDDLVFITFHKASILHNEVLLAEEYQQTSVSNVGCVYMSRLL